MGLRINTNVPSLIAQRNVRNTRRTLDSTLEKLSSGSRINHAGDDAAGLAISESLRAQIRGLGQAERNAQDGVSLVQVAEGALGEVSNILIRMRELGVQASSDTVGAQERKFIDIEYQQLLEEIDRITQSTKYNGVPILTGNSSAFEIQIGTGNNPALDRVTLFDPFKADINVTSLGLNLTGVGEKLSAQNSLEAIDKSLNQVTSVRAEFGAMQNRLQSVVNNIAVTRENLSSADSRVRDTDLATETTNLTRDQILMQAGISVLTQANSNNKVALQLLQQS